MKGYTILFERHLFIYRNSQTEIYAPRLSTGRNLQRPKKKLRTARNNHDEGRHNPLGDD